MEMWPHPFKRGDKLDRFEGQFIGGIGAFSAACISGRELEEPLEVVLFEGSKEKGFHARLGDAHHHLYEGPLTEAQVSFALEVFKTDPKENILQAIKKDSNTFSFAVKRDLQNFILETTHKLGIQGALLYIEGASKDLHIYGHKDIHKLNDQTKTFDHVPEPAQIEGWGNLSFVDGDLGKPFVHMHGTYKVREKKKGGHYIMDDKKRLLLEAAELLIFPIPKLIRTLAEEDFPTWKI